MEVIKVSMLILAIGLATIFNIVIIIHKVRKVRLFDAALDMSIMCAICAIFSGTFSALVVGMIASMGVSIYLLFNPVYIIAPDSSLRTMFSNVVNNVCFWR